ncbi:hypothetical protein HFN20_15025 [Paenibacillus dendritiformis]|uniref:hypothetical protein n=1 Tax=Paenibacillus dendritiformis TaxID=130049 RepID=UPI00143DEEF9|nr:hypothetical protein [Paenibacillus dendritiformis]NKI22513.1 hypothetical protein [Paenibacillus dendritiformis]NRF97658.1 hypothetical protein [Paenibacillus dendritiformis]
MEDAYRRFIRISVHRMCDHYAPKLDMALESLSSEDVWRKESGQANSIGGIVLHIGEHIRRHNDRYSIHGHAAAGGIENFFPDECIEVNILRSRTAETFGEWKRLISRHLAGEVAVERLDMADVYHLVEHTGYHLGQIIDRAQRLSGLRFQFMQRGINERHLKKLLEDEK